MATSDAAPLRAVGIADEAIVDAAQLIGYFNFNNRVMGSLGIEPEPEMRFRSAR